MDTEKLKSLLSTGKTIPQTARVLGESTALVYYYVKKLKLFYTKAIVEAHYTGKPCDMEKVNRIKEQIKNGTYEINAGNIADKLIQVLNYD